MKRIARIIGTFLIAALLVSGVPFMAQPASAQDNGIIDGTVIDSVTLQPIANLNVFALDYNTGEVAEVLGNDPSKISGLRERFIENEMICLGNGQNQTIAQLNKHFWWRIWPGGSDRPPV